MAEMAAPEWQVDAREFTREVAKAVMMQHGRRYSWIDECMCGLRMPCEAQAAHRAGVKAIFAALDERDRLLAEAAELRDQWGVRDDPSGLVDEYETEDTARQLAHYNSTIVRRVITGWREADPSPERGGNGG